MDDVKDVRECVVHSLGYKCELTQKCVLRNGMRLCYDEVISVAEQVEGIL